MRLEWPAWAHAGRDAIFDTIGADNTGGSLAITDLSGCDGFPPI